MPDNIAVLKKEVPPAVDPEYEPSTELKQTDLAEGERETVEEDLRLHEKTDRPESGPEDAHEPGSEGERNRKRYGTRRSHD